jgi:hypothetical protein
MTMIFVISATYVTSMTLLTRVTLVMSVFSRLRIHHYDRSRRVRRAGSNARWGNVQISVQIGIGQFQASLAIAVRRG